MARRVHIDLVVPVYNSLHHARVCLESVLAHASQPYHLYVINDASDEHTSHEIQEIVGGWEGDATLVTHCENQGYLRSINDGIGYGTGEIVILLNSDAALLPGTLERIEEDFARDPRIGIINPVSTRANWTRVPFPAGTNILTLNELVRELGEDELADIGNASGFFFAVRRKLFRELGLFDEAYHPGYWEEADFCMRALEAGHRVAVDRKLYVFHHGWGSFEQQGRDEHMGRNREVFLSRWRDAYGEIEKAWRLDDPVKTLSSRLTDAPMVNTLDCLRVVYLLPNMELSGRTLSVVQLVNRLITLGVDVTVATVGAIDDSVLRQMPMYFRPYVASRDELLNRLPTCDLIVATQWSTVYLAMHLASPQPSVRLIYSVQDFEPASYPENSDEFRDAERTYRMIENKIVTSPWMADRIAIYGGAVHQVPPGLNLDVFYPRENARRPRLVSIVESGSAQSNWPMIKAVYNELANRHPDIELALFGSGYSTSEIGAHVHDYGQVRETTRMAEIFNQCTALLDCSRFKAFGRVGLEAMACGTAAILTCEGGITTYAKHLYNCVLIEPNDQTQIISSIERVFDEVALRNRLTAQGLATVKSFSHRVEAGRTLELFERLTGKEFIPTGPSASQVSAVVS